MSLSGANTLIVAPHPDDETLGCGGLIWLKRRLGADVQIVFLTRGEGSLRGYAQVSPDAVAEERMEHARAACRRLGVEASSLHWLSLRDGAIPRAGGVGFDAAVWALAELIDKFSPEEVVAPSPADALPDHGAASQIVAAALHLSGKPIRLIHYLVWGWYNAPWGMRQFPWKRAWRLDISSALPAKRAAMRCYLDRREPTSGLPYCGKLPSALMACGMKRDQVFFDG